MFQSIAVPLDGSHFSEQSIPTAVDLAAGCDASLHLVHVHVPPMTSRLTADPAVPNEAIASGIWEKACRRGEVRPESA